MTEPCSVPQCLRAALPGQPTCETHRPLQLAKELRRLADEAKRLAGVAENDLRMSYWMAQETAFHAASATTQPPSSESGTEE